MALAEIGQFVGKKTAGAIITIAVVAGGIWCWQHPGEVKALGQVVKLVFVWLLIAAALPWSSYLFMRPMLRFQSENLSAGGAAVAGFAMIGAYTCVDVLVALYMNEWTAFSGGFTWLVVLIGFAAAAAYNYVICESLARHADT